MNIFFIETEKQRPFAESGLKGNQLPGAEKGRIVCSDTLSGVSLAILPGSLMKAWHWPNT
jgi:hypothetical protein